MAYMSPGVYVEDVPSNEKTIEGVGTSIAAFVGVVEDTVTMPKKPGDSGENYPLIAVNTPKRITSWESFKSSFGDIQSGNKLLAHSVYGFFNNGGTTCYVVRSAENTADAYEAALNKLKSIDEIAIVAIPGNTDDAVQDKLLSHCEKMKDRFAILDGNTALASEEFTKANITTSRYSIDGYAAIYFPWIKVYDPETKGTIVVPPSGHIAGIYSRSDNDRGVHKAPANEVIRGALGLEYELSKEDQDGLNPENINVIRNFSGSMTIWGARTWSDKGLDPEWKYVNVRRLMNFLRESIEESTRWVVFEPNDNRLWQKIKRNVNAFLTNVYRSGALFGASAEEAFYVKCDADTNPVEVRNLGQVVTEIGVALVKPAEFVIFRISQSEGKSDS